MLKEKAEFYKQTIKKVDFQASKLAGQSKSILEICWFHSRMTQWGIHCAYGFYICYYYSTDKSEINTREVYKMYTLVTVF